jgi:hypothetical protein
MIGDACSFKNPPTFLKNHEQVLPPPLCFQKNLRNSNNANSFLSKVGNQLLFANNRNRVRWIVLCLLQDGACIDHSENSLKPDLSNNTTVNPAIFSMVNTFKPAYRELGHGTNSNDLFLFQELPWSCSHVWRTEVHPLPGPEWRGCYCCPVPPSSYFLSLSTFENLQIFAVKIDNIIKLY